MTRKTITSNGMEWAVISRNEREATHKDRHFFASRCNSSRPWRIEEHDKKLGIDLCATTLRHFGGEHETKQLTQEVMEICGAPKQIQTCKKCMCVCGPEHKDCPQCGALL